MTATKIDPSLESRLRGAIRDVPDFPKPGINFYDITTLLKDPLGLHQTIDALAQMCDTGPIDTVIGVESRGFIFSAPMAYQLDESTGEWLPFEINLSDPEELSAFLRGEIPRAARSECGHPSSR